MKSNIHKNAFKFILAGTIVLTPMAANLAVTSHTAYAATETTDIVSFHSKIYSKLTASDIADIKAAYSNIAKVDFASKLGTDLVTKIDNKTSNGTAVKIASDLAKLEYKTNTTDFKTALDQFKKDHADDFTKIFDGRLSVEQAVSLFGSFEQNLEQELVKNFIDKKSNKFDDIVINAINATLAEPEFKGFDGLFTEKIDVSMLDLLKIKADSEAVIDPSKSAQAGLTSGLIRANGGDINGANTVELNSSAPTYSLKVVDPVLGIPFDITNGYGIEWKTNNSSIATISGNKLIAKKTGKVKVQAWYLNMPIITKDVIIQDTKAPAAPLVNSFSNIDHVISGKAEANSTITVKSGKTTIATGKTASNGTFALPIRSQKAGTYLTVTAKDAAGNVSSAKTIKVLDKYTAVPTVYTVTNTDTVIKGKAEALSTVTVKNGKTTVASGKTASNGTFSIKMKSQYAGTILTVTAKDASGNVSKAATVKVIDKYTPQPTVYTVHHTDTLVKGKAEAGATITISYGSRVLATGVTSNTGTFSVKIPTQRKGTVLYISAKDQAKNVSKRTVVVVK